MNHNIYTRNRRFFLIIIDIVTIVLCFFSAFYLRFDFTIPQEWAHLFKSWLPISLAVQITIFNIFGFYQVLWRFTSLWELLDIIKLTSISFIITLISIGVMSKFAIHPASILLIFYFLNLLTTCMTRISVRLYHSHFKNKFFFEKQIHRKKLILIGAGKTGEKIAREIINTPDAPFEIVGFVDDDASRINGKLHGYKVIGPISSLKNIIIPFDELLITAPSATGEQMRKIVGCCKQTGKPYKTVPALTELIDKDVSLAAVREVAYVDLLGRDEVYLDMNSIGQFLNGKRVLITGAGGSIGSELVRQCLVFNPAEVICVDISEENLFGLATEIEMQKKQTIFKPILADILKKNQMEKVFNDNRPQIIFHAAAYKHVPIQELHPWSAVETNVGGTLTMIQMADKYNAEKFVLVSTDKAVNPVNVMGATKRLSEMLIQSMNKISKTQFLAVRFGNVLGSSGSAIPTFQKQINNGGPVTITHPQMTRYFMSIQEASQLILQSSTLGADGDIFLLEMGKPIKIDRMARDLIKLSGLEPELDIPIVYTGLRPGEKLYEELQFRDENVIKTEHTKIMVLKDNKRYLPWETLFESIKKLLDYSKELDSDKIQMSLKSLLPSYQPRPFTNVNEELELAKPYIIKGEA